MPVLGDAHNTAKQGPEQPDLRQPCFKEGTDQMGERHLNRPSPIKLFL